MGPDPAPATIVLHSPDALRRIVTAPGELGLSRAYVSGDVDLEGDAFAVLELRHHLEGLDVGRRQVLELLRIVGLTGLKPLPAPAEEARPRGRLHSRRRDASDVSHHYDVGNEFYE
ncbi:MAG: SAM-dependent methyltransferase, partial [Acidimicrobiales bacterium]